MRSTAGSSAELSAARWPIAIAAPTPGTTGSWATSPSLELRRTVASLDAFGTRVSLELTPFVDSGRVFANGASPFSHMLTAPGVGVRAVASPFIVGYVDVGYDDGKAAVFSGINYPF